MLLDVTGPGCTRCGQCEEKQRTSTRADGKVRPASSTQTKPPGPEGRRGVFVGLETGRRCRVPARGNFLQEKVLEAPNGPAGRRGMANVRGREWPCRRAGDVLSEHRGRRLPDQAGRAWNVHDEARRRAWDNQPRRERRRRQDREKARRGSPV